MNLERCHLEEQLRTTRLESMELRRKLHELNTEFVQLRQAFEIKLRTQKHREIRLDRLTHENQEIRKFAEECLRNITEMRRMLKEVESERDFWKGRAMREQKETDRRRNEIEILEESIRKEREDTLKGMQNETETRLAELSGLYDEAKEKVHRLEEETIEMENRKRSFEIRARELANLLATLEHFDLDIKTVCRLTATAVENLTEMGLSFEETVKKLRQFTWKADNRKSDTEVDTLRSQNLVLREIVKSLKRKARFRSENQSSKVDCSKESIDEGEKKIEESHDSCNNAKVDANDVRETRNELPIEHEASSREKSDHFVNGASCGNCSGDGQTNINEETECSGLFTMEHNRENKDTVSSVNEKMLCIESHTNGIFFEEYVIGFSNSRQMKIKHSPETSAKAAHLKLEFVDCEDKYQENFPDKVVILLKNVWTSIKIERTGINCATQTVLTRKCNNHTQTSIADIRDFRRLNAGHTVSMMLNSEKRAIERNLSNLERTVADLKHNTLSHARSMIGKNSKYSGNNEFFECIERLTGD
ncbi:hypothetical protein KPH14_010191 [Odynerus spinipes]|uniref:Uncharacterized protein n=1 Tax=Odynerus spinipes TaxID=1348599 RepID=A0AAD9RTA9_9HYME|nr:hypothetical protein KPH14_010191 [Odynerus spinipes]